MAKRTITDTLRLASSHAVPQLGFGVYKSPPELCIQSCLTALGAGYRHVDTAQYYANEAEVGEAVRRSGLDRRDVFLTTKILSPEASAEANYQKCLESVRKLDGDSGGYVDLFLIHSPNCGGAQNRMMLWQTLERLHQEGKAKSIGVSNFGIQHIEDLKKSAKVWPPHVNQIELHPWSQQTEIVEYCEKQGIAIEAYCPLVRNTKATDPDLTKVAEKHGVTPNQVLVRYCLERNWIPLPKSDNAGRIKTNADVFGFALDKEDMGVLNELNQGAAGAIVQAVSN
ncbi:NADP-dependent oxidoreductase domain-containing protein [Apiospora kogelbergensis]|uniref:NADP-dependent oxidoreductase domain-containing protein n=1 Tax=Apiospora kogelbergensis TaxID=1337665 RepID=UPI0031309CB3